MWINNAFFLSNQKFLETFDEKFPCTPDGKFYEPTNEYFFYIGFTSGDGRLGNPLDYCMVTGSKGEQPKIKEAYHHLHRVEFYITEGSGEVSESKMIDKYILHKRCLNASKGSKTDGYVYLVVFKKNSRCLLTELEIEQILKDGKQQLSINAADFTGKESNMLLFLIKF